MRVLKFRAWDKDLKRMSKPFKLGDFAIFWNDDDTPMPLEFGISKGRLVIQPFSGLYDERQKEIYDGDIVRRNKYCRDENKCNTGQITQFTSWGGFGYKQIKDEFTHPCEGDLSLDQCIPLMNSNVASLEIIGNIYENPELLS